MCQISAYFNFCWQRRGGSWICAHPHPVLPPLPVPSLTLCPLQAAETFSLLLQQQTKFWPPNANRNHAQDSVRAQQRLCHTRETEAHMGPGVNRRIKVLCIPTKSEIYDVLHSPHSNLKEWWKYSFPLLFLKLFWCHSNCLCWLFNHLTSTDARLLMFWQLSLISHPFITQGVGKKSQSVHYEPTEWRMKEEEKDANNCVWLLAANTQTRGETARGSLNWIREYVWGVWLIKWKEGHLVKPLISLLHFVKTPAYF